MSAIEQKERYIEQYEQALIRNKDAMHRQDESRLFFEKQKSQFRDMILDANRTKDLLMKERNLKFKKLIRQRLERKMDNIHNARQNIRVFVENPAIAQERYRLLHQQRKVDELKFEIATEKNHKNIYDTMKAEIAQGKDVGKAMFDAEQRAGRFDRRNGIKDFREYMAKNHLKEFNQNKQEMRRWLAEPDKIKDKDKSETQKNLDKVKSIHQNKRSLNEIAQSIKPKEKDRGLER